VNLFIGRKDILDRLKQLPSHKSNMIVVRGRRRIGKSRLIQEYAKKKRFLEFSGIPPTSSTTVQDELDHFMTQFVRNFACTPITVTDWSYAFMLLSDRLTEEETVIFLDEISWMGSRDPHFIGKLKAWWDTVLSHKSNVQLVLCGSVSTWIEQNIINSTALFGRISLTVTLEELSLRESLEFLAALGIKGSPFELLTLLSVTGGVPWYLEQLSAHLLPIENIKKICFTAEGALFNEFDHIFHDLFDIRNTVYMKIIMALSTGLKNLSDIQHALGYKKGGTLTPYLRDLRIAGFITEHPSWSIKTGKKGKKTLYRLSDNYLRFYIKYILPQKDNILTKKFKSTSLEDLPGWDSMIGFQVENLILNNREYLLKELDVAPLRIVADNPYYQYPTKAKRGCQIDYLIQTMSRTLIVCEFKFQKREIGIEIIDEMKKKIKHLSVPREYGIAPVLVHLSGVSHSVIKSNYFYRIIDIQNWIGD
jgi:hypothetical protein